MNIINKYRLAFGFLIIIIDQLLKHGIRQSGGFYICNKGIAFGIPLYFGIGLALIGMTFFLGAYFLLGENIFCEIKKYELSIVFILSGAISNIIDRCFFGCVIDFIDIGILNYPLFNIADFFIFVGVAYIFIKNVELFKK